MQISKYWLNKFCAWSLLNPHFSKKIKVKPVIVYSTLIWAYHWHSNTQGDSTTSRHVYWYTILYDIITATLMLKTRKKMNNTETSPIELVFFNLHKSYTLTIMQKIIDKFIYTDIKHKIKKICIKKSYFPRIRRTTWEWSSGLTHECPICNWIYTTASILYYLKKYSENVSSFFFLLFSTFFCYFYLNICNICWVLCGIEIGKTNYTWRLTCRISWKFKYIN